MIQHYNFSKMKNLILYFSIASLLLSCQSTTVKKASPMEQCILNVLMMDDSIGAVRNHACETMTLETTIENYVAGMGTANLTDCPAVFREAFKNHRVAWKNMIPLVAKYPDMRGEMHDLFDVIAEGEDAEEFEVLLKAIWDTWDEVEAAK